MLPQGTVIIQPPQAAAQATTVATGTPTVTRSPATVIQAQAAAIPQAATPQVVLINSAALQPQLIVPTGQVSVSVVVVVIVVVIAVVLLTEDIK